MRALLTRFTSYLDSQALWEIRLWQFMKNNLTRGFSWYFLFRGYLRFPLQAARGIKHYKGLVRQNHPKSLKGTLSQDDLFDFLHQNPQQKFLIAPGFCMKPYDSEHQQSMCPAGHFNHNCLLIENLSSSTLPAPCQQCGIAPLVQAAAKLGADVYIMTSALDIARDLFLPAMRTGEKYAGLFFLCPYSTEPFTFGLATAGIQGALVTFCHGACADHATWTRADKGVKNEQTFVKSQEFEHLLWNLEKISSGKRYKQEIRYQQINNIYHSSEI